MAIEVSEYISVSAKLKSFGLESPQGLSILPFNLASAESVDDLRQYVESDTVRTLLNQHKIEYVEIFDEDTQPPYLEQYGSEWFGPTLLISAGLLSENPHVLAVTLGLITNYLYEWFRGSKDNKATLDVVLQELDSSCKRVHYSGPVEGLADVDKVVKELMNKV